MAAPSNLWDGGFGSPTAEQALGRRRARRLSRRFSRVGVDISPARLRAISAGTDATSDELAEVRFAVFATATRLQQRRAKISRVKRHAVQALVVAALVLTALNLLASSVYIMLSLLLHESPF